jgi:uncharacterized lipoprotein
VRATFPGRIGWMGVEVRHVLLLLGAVVLLLAGCDSAHMTAYTPVDQKTSLSAKVLYEAAVASLEDNGYNLEKQDPATFEITTVQRTHNVSELSHTKYHYVWNVSAADGRLGIKLTCEMNSGAHATKFEPCGDKAPQHLVDEQQKLRDAILTQAHGS